MSTNARWSDRHPVLAGVRTSVLVSLAGTLLGALAHSLVPLAPQRAAWEWLGADVAHPRGLWLALGLATGAWLIYGARRAFLWRTRRSPAYESYRMDEFCGLRWRWRWYLGEATGAKAFCPECDMELRPVLLDGGDRSRKEVLYRCPAGHVARSVPGTSHVAVERDIARLVEREARSHGLLKD